VSHLGGRKLFEIDFLKVGDKANAEAIALRFTRPDTGDPAVVTIDGGWQEDGQTVVDLIRDAYGTSEVDLAILTHPDGDHIGGMGTIVRGLNVTELLLHRIDKRAPDLAAAAAVADLVKVAESRGTVVTEPWAGTTSLGGALTILGPDQAYYDELLGEEILEESAKVAAPGTGLRAAISGAFDRFLAALPIEIRFDDGPGCGARNNSSVISLFDLGGPRALFTGDAGVPALERALSTGLDMALDVAAPDVIQIPHHGSRRNASSDLLDRMLGPIGGKNVGQGFVSVATDSDPKHPAGRVINAYKRRGYSCYWTARGPLRRHSPDAPYRPGTPASELAPMDESDEE
jgi:beta-lactamase superfamily II metal-dependent hydrolase